MASIVVPRSAERLVFGAALALLLMVVVCVAIIGSLNHQQRCADGSLLDRPPTAAAAAAIPPQLMPIFQQAEQRYGVAWSVLAAINKVETDFGRNMGVSSAGAIGWMQFMPATWRRYGVDADGDGHKDPYNPKDAIPAAANYLRASGAPGDLRDALFAYNHAEWYVQQVLSLAHSYAQQDPDETAPRGGHRELGARRRRGRRRSGLRGRGDRSGAA
jgi:soluble lytic murein transglycosylase-like protein